MTWRVLLEAAEAVRATLVEPATADLRIADLRIAGIGWATVDHERAQRDLDAMLAADPNAPQLQPWAAMERDSAIGARAWRRDAEDETSYSSLVVLEPDTEGRLAAFLARFGEGVGVLYLGSGAPRPGRLALGGPAWGPHIVVLAVGAR